VERNRFERSAQWSSQPAFAALVSLDVFESLALTAAQAKVKLFGFILVENPHNRDSLKLHAIDSITHNAPSRGNNT
jgi:hypothetical protein